MAEKSVVYEVITIESPHRAGHSDAESHSSKKVCC